MQLDAKALADATAEIVRSHVAQATAPLLRRIEQLESCPLPEQGKQGDPGPAGPGVTNAIIDRSGVLIFTLSDGSVLDVGVVVGKDGLDGCDNALDDEATAALLSATLAEELRGPIIELPPPAASIMSEARNVQPVNVNLHNHIPRQRKERTLVTRHDDSGRIAEFERHYED